MKWFFTFSILLFSIISIAQEAIVYRSVQSAQKAFVISENNVWKVRINSYQNGWPEQIAEYTFKSLPQAQKYLATYHFLMNASNTEMQKEIELRGDSSEMIWIPKNNWNWDWELKFANWIQNDVDTDFYQKYKLKTDCADVMYSLRWIFARMNYLPAANKTMDGVWFTHRSLKNEWKDLKTNSDWSKDQRFLAGLKFIMKQSYTHTLHKDSYPIALNATAMLPGSFHLIVSGKSGHTMVIYRQLPATDGVRVIVMASTVPSAVRVLSEHMMYPAKFDPKKDSVRRMRWPVINGDKVSLVEPEKMPHYSLEQFTDNEVNVNRILNPNPNWKVEYDQAIASVLELLNQRKLAVENGFKACAPNKCAPDSSLYDQHSTPSRDLRLKQALGYLENEIAQNYQDYTIRKTDEKIFDLFNESFSLAQIFRVVNSSLFSSNPNDEIGRRWLLGSQNYARIHKEELLKSLVLRRAKIQKALKECRYIELCTPQSKNYESVNLYNEMQSVISFNEILRSYYTEEHKEFEFEQYQKMELSDGIIQKTLSEWILTLEKASTDPRSVPSMLEGDWTDLFYQFELPAKMYIQRIEKNWIVLTKENSINQMYLKKMGLQNGMLLLQSSGLCSADDKIEADNISQKWVLVLCGDEYRKINIENGQTVLTFPKSLVIDRKFTFIDGQKLVSYDSELRDKPYQYEVMKNVTVYDVEKSKTLFISQAQDQVLNIQIAQNGKFLSVSVLTGSDENQVFTEIHNYDLRSPSQSYRKSQKTRLSSTIQEWYYQNSRDLLISDSYITLSDENNAASQEWSILQTSKYRSNEFLTYSIDSERISFQKLKVIPETLQVVSEVISTYKKMSTESFNLNEDKNVGLLFEQELALLISDTPAGFQIRQSTLQNLTWKVTPDYTIKISVKNKKIDSKVYRANGDLAFSAPGQLYEMSLEFLHPEHFLYRSYEPLDSSGKLSSSRFSDQVILNNYNYSNQNGLIIYNNRVLLILK